MKQFLFLIALSILAAGNTFAQIRPVDDATETSTKAPPPTFEAKYEGGMFGYGQKENGTLKFDDINERLVFFGKDGKEKFSVPYDAMLVVYPNSESATSTTGNVIRNIPLPGAGLGSLIKEKRRFLVIQYADPDVDAKGTVNFRVENKETLDAVIPAIGEKAKLVQRGDAYYRPRTTKGTT